MPLFVRQYGLLSKNRGFFMLQGQRGGFFASHKAVWKLMRELGLFRTFYCAKFVVKCTCKNMQYSLFDIMWLTGNGE